MLKLNNFFCSCLDHGKLNFGKINYWFQWKLFPAGELHGNKDKILLRKVIAVFFWLKLYSQLIENNQHKLIILIIYYIIYFKKYSIFIINLHEKEKEKGNSMNKNNMNNSCNKNKNNNHEESNGSY